MFNLLRDIALSFCPASVKSLHRPCSSASVLRGAIITGAFQTFVCSRWFLSGLMAFVSLRSQQYGSVLQLQNESTQAWFAILSCVEYLMFHPLALLLFYLAFEGFIRFVVGLCISETVPSLPVVLGFTIKTYADLRKKRSELAALNSISDSFEIFADGERLRVAASRAKSSWNASLTICVAGEWYEVEREEKGTPPRDYVYILRRAPVGKVLRAYEEYNLGITIKSR